MDKPPFEESLRALAARRRGGESHPTPDELIAYRAGDLTPEEDDLIQEHLTQCRDCARLLLDLAEFEQLPPPPEEIGPVDIRAEASWQRLRSRLREENETEEEPGQDAPILQHRPRPRVPFWRTPALPWALAAGLTIGVVGLGLRTASLQQKVGELSAPKANVPLIDLYPESERTRGEAQPEEQAGGSSVLFLHLPTDSPELEAYEVEIVAAAGKELVFEPQPMSEQDGSVTLQLPPSPLPSGSYTIRLYGLADGRRQLLDQYSFEVPAGAS